MKTVTITSHDVAERIVTSFELYKKGFKSKDEHLAFCSSIRFLFGNDFYYEACDYAKDMVKE